MNSKNITIVNLTEEDIPEITNMCLKLWPECNYNDEYENLLKILQSNFQVVIVAKMSNQVIGFIELSLRTDFVEGTTSSPVLYIEAIYINPKYRQLGIAKQLVDQSKLWGLDHNCLEIASDTEINNKSSIDFHKSIGFKEVNRIVCFSQKINIK